MAHHVTGGSDPAARQGGGVSYLYNSYEGSLPDLERRLEAVDEDDTLEQLDGITDETWRLVETDLLSEIDWHELDDVVALAERRIPDTSTLLHDRFEDPPLGITPDGFGWSGSLDAEERRRLDSAAGQPPGRPRPRREEQI